MQKGAPDESSELDIDEIKSFYDSVYYAGEQPGTVPALDRHHIGLVRKLGIESGQKVLDVACGTGGWLLACDAVGASVSGVDLSEKAIAICRERLPGGEFYAQPAETLPFSTDSFDVVTCLGSLEHFVDPVGSLREMARVARPGATFLILVPNKDFLTRKLGLFGGTFQVDAREVVRTLEEWQSLFSSAGLTVEGRWRDLHMANTSWICRGPVYMWPLRALQCLMLMAWPLRWQYQVYFRCRNSAG